MIDDTELLRRYAENRDEDAFADLVRRHVNLVHSAALRQVNGDTHLAADITQTVFTDLARKAASLTQHRVLAGWLFTSTRFAAAKAVRGERRRQAREQEAHTMEELTRDPAAALDWTRVRPVLDEALGALNEPDREAILLRFFEGRDFAGVGAQLNLSDNTARMRVERALDKLRAQLERRGLTSTSAALATVLANQAVLAAPAGLAGTVTGAALGAGGTIATATGAATLMSMSKLQIGLAGAVAAAGVTGFVVQAETQAGLRREMETWKAQQAAMVAARAENQQLRRTVAEADELRGDDAELTRLRDEAAALKTQLQARATAARAVSTEVFDISRVDQQPAPRFQARPQYPFEMRRAGITGEAVVDFIVDTNGDVQNAVAIRSSQREFEGAAVAAVSKWKFKPGRKDARDVNTHLQVPIVFTLSEEEQATAATRRPADQAPAPKPKSPGDWF